LLVVMCTEISLPTDRIFPCQEGEGVIPQESIAGSIADTKEYKS